MQRRHFCFHGALFFAIVLSLFSFCGALLAEIDLASLEEKLSTEITEIKGTPKVRVVSNQKETFRVELKEKDQSDYALAIRKEGNNYIWISRDGKVLKRELIGTFDYFISERGSDYIKIVREASVLNPLKGFTASVQEEQFGCKYIEHMSDKLNTVTYFGDCDMR